LNIPIVPESEEDVKAAKSISFGDALQEDQVRQRKLTAHALPLFKSTRSTRRQSTTSKSNLAQQILLNTRRKMDPFLVSNSFANSSRSSSGNALNGVVKRNASTTNTGELSK
jgi:hypothetical protein